MSRNLPFARFVSQPARRRLLIAVMILLEFAPLIAVALLVAFSGSNPSWL